MVTCHKQHTSLFKIVALSFWVPPGIQQKENNSPRNVLILCHLMIVNLIRKFFQRSNSLGSKCVGGKLAMFGILESLIFGIFPLLIPMSLVEAVFCVPTVAC